MPFRLTSWLLAIALLGCGGERLEPDGGIVLYRDLGPRPDYGSWDPGIPPDAGSDATMDGGATDGAVDGGPGCGPGAACNARLAADGSCPGDCVPLDHGVRCEGVVEGALCYGGGETPPRIVRAGLPAALETEAMDLPESVVVGEERTLRVRFTNGGDRSLSLPLTLAAGPAFALVAADAPATLDLAAGESLLVVARVRASRFNATAPSAWTAVRFDFGGGERTGLQLRVPVYDTGGRLCGGHFFPASALDLGEGGDYLGYACCDELFHPGSECCDDGVCGGGACVDGTCVRRVSVTRYGASPLGAPVHVLLVIADRDDVPAAPEGVCADQSAALRETFGLDRVSAWFRDRFEARTGLTAPPWRFTVLTGVDSEDLTGAPLDDMRSYAAALEAYLADHGCLDSFQADFDRVVIHDPRFVTEHGGLAFDVDRVGLRAYTPTLLVHELGHSFGATDLYMDARGSHANDGAVMSHAGGPEPGRFRDDILRGEVGLDDVDGNGVIDCVDYSHAPDSLVLTGLTVESRGFGSIDVTFRVAGVEDGAPRPIVPRDVVLELPDLAESEAVDLIRARSVENDGTLLRVRFSGLDADAVATGEPLRVRVRGRADFSRSDFEREHRFLDTEVTVTVASTFGTTSDDIVPDPPAR